MSSRNEKPFILVRRGRFIFNITPRNASGWIQMGVWMALFAAMTAGFSRFDEARPAGSTFGAADAAFLVCVLVWAIGGVWWMRARSEVVDLEQMLKLKREAERKRRG